MYAQYPMTTPTPSLTSGSLWLTANFRADFWPNLSYYWFEKKNLFRIVEKMNNFRFVINFLELLKKFFIQYLTANLHCSANSANKSATQEGAFRERLGYGVDYILIFTIKLFQILSSRGSSIIREIKRILTHTCFVGII